METNVVAPGRYEIYMQRVAMLIEFGQFSLEDIEGFAGHVHESLQRADRAFTDFVLERKLSENVLSAHANRMRSAARYIADLQQYLSLAKAGDTVALLYARLRMAWLMTEIELTEHYVT